MLMGPGDRYRLAIDVLAARGGNALTRFRAVSGVPVPDEGGSDGATLVMVDEAVSLVVVPGENGFTVRSLKLLGADRAVVTAVVTAGATAPEWLPAESTYMLFQGDRTDAAAAPAERFVSLEGLTDAQTAPPQGATPLDKLVVALGRSVARANAALAQSPAPGGVALVSSLTIRLAVEQTNVGQGRVLVTLARPGQETPSGQYVELTMSTVPGAEPEEPTDAPQAGTTTTAQQNSTPAGDSARTGVRIIAGDQSRR
jgi:hypothetical protein